MCQILASLAITQDAYHDRCESEWRLYLNESSQISNQINVPKLY